MAGWAIGLLIASHLKFNLSGSDLGNFSTGIEHLQKNLIGAFVQKFSSQQLAALGAAIPMSAGEGLPDKVILVIVESFSASDSRRTSGLKDLFPRFDRISREGVLFTNFLANGFNSEDGLISLLVGEPPLVYPGMPFDRVNAFRYQDAPLRRLRERGYQLIFLSSATLQFRNKRDLLSGLGFHEYVGLDEVEKFRNGPHYAFGAAPDRSLYEEAFSRIRRTTAAHPKFLMVVETTSSRLPYQDPAGRGDSEENVLSYVDESLASFYEALKADRFFEQGILVVTGDHRKMLPISDIERERYGSSAGARIPLWVVGKNIRAEVVDDRLFQQADLLRKFSDVMRPDVTLSSAGFNVESYTSPLIGANSSMVRVFTKEGGEFVVSMLGQQITWLNSFEPKGARAIESDLMARMAKLQYCYDNQPLCARLAKNE